MRSCPRLGAATDVLVAFQALLTLTDPVRMRAGRCEVNVGYITPEEIRARLVVVSIRVAAAPSGMTILLFSWLEK